MEIKMNRYIPKILTDIAKELHRNGANAVLVGGAVRDFVLQKDVKDFDIEVYNIESYDKLAAILSKFGAVNLVGKSFGVVKLRVGDNEYDFSMPRLENKTGKGHKGFDIKVNPKLKFEEAAKRRDFTMNAMGWDILQNRLLDPFKGVDDIKNKVLQIVDKKTFTEDPLRVYRALQFAARFELDVTEETRKLCCHLVDSGALEELPKERVWEEFKKLLLKADKPSIGLKLMREFGILKYFPQLKALIGVEQDPVWHPEGDVWTHTLMVVDEAAKLRSGNEFEDLILMLAALCHDFGKPLTTKIIDGRVRAFNHDTKGVKPALDFLTLLTDHKELKREVAKLVEFHLRPLQLFKGNAKKSAVRRLSLKVNIKRLVKLAQADYFGRGGTDKNRFEAGEWLFKMAQDLNCLEKPPKKLLQGRDLIELGLKPSPLFGEILKQVYEAQIEGKIATKEDAIKLAKKLYIY